jgi:hypothetical protein
MLLLSSTSTGGRQQLRLDNTNLVINGGDLVLQADISNNFANVTLDNSLTANHVFILGPGSSTAAANLRYNAGGSMEILVTSSLSEQKLKQQKLDASRLPALLDLEPTTWIDREEWKANKRSAKGLRRITGLLAEHVEQVTPEYAEYDAKGSLVGVDYRAISVAMLPVLKDHQQRIEKLEKVLSKS